MVGMKFIDPICSMAVDETSPLRLERDGVTYYFCSEHCRRKFAESGLKRPANAPERESSTSGVRPPRAPGRYFCPMCEGVESDRPGVCPRCGMALESADVTAGPAEELDLETKEMMRGLKIAIVLTVPVFLLAMSDMSTHSDIWISISRRLQFLLALPVVLISAKPLFIRGLKGVLAFNPNMFTLIALGTGAAFLYSTAALLFPSLFPREFAEHAQVPIYFEAASVIVTLVLLGQVLEGRARRKTRQSIRELLLLSPSIAHLVIDGRETDVTVERVEKGALLRVRPGEKVPVDGTIVEGTGFLDESMISGEPMPQRKEIGDLVTGATLNQSGAFLMRAEKVGEETVLAQIVKLIAQAQQSRAPIQQLVDRVSAYFVPIVVVIAIITFDIWFNFGPSPRFAYALINAVAVLIIACPCAIGLATPMAVTVGLGRGARSGVLVREAAALQAMERVDTVIVDKTGTITEGKPEVTALIPAPGVSGDELIRVAASIGQLSEHPLSRAVVKNAAEKKIQLWDCTDFEVFPGEGISGSAGGRHYYLGRKSFVRSRGIVIDSGSEGSIGAPAEEGKTLLFIGADSGYLGCLILADRIKATSPEALRSLSQLGLRVIMLTGDRQEVAARVASELGLSEFEAELTPKEKLNRVHALKIAGAKIAVAGDGINDAPALVEADVGIAMAGGTDVAIESADITLLRGDLRGIVRARNLSRRTMKTVRQNLFLALIYNSISIPLAAGLLYPLFGVFLSPMVGALAMSLSSVSVIANSLRLRGMRLE